MGLWGLLGKPVGVFAAAMAGLEVALFLVVPNFLHRAWLKQWQELIPAYIDWQIGQQENWKVEKTEVDIETSLEGLSRILKGRIDRIDTSQDGDSVNMDILDYKTGRIARLDDVIAGESIQLPFYALLAKQYIGKKATRAEFVSIDNGKVQAKSTLEGDDLSVLTDQVGQRLVELIAELEDGQPMVAWGNDEACKWCQMSGVCRREAWVEKHETGS
jgi:ATP-dependent helicase/nuclease subunit B